MLVLCLTLNSLREAFSIMKSTLGNWLLAAALFVPLATASADSMTTFSSSTTPGGIPPMTLLFPTGSDPMTGVFTLDVVDGVLKLMATYSGSVLIENESASPGDFTVTFTSIQLHIDGDGLPGGGVVLDLGPVSGSVSGVPAGMTGLITLGPAMGMISEPLALALPTTGSYVLTWGMSAPTIFSPDSKVGRIVSRSDLIEGKVVVPEPTQFAPLLALGLLGWRLRPGRRL